MSTETIPTVYNSTVYNTFPAMLVSYKKADGNQVGYSGSLGSATLAPGSTMEQGKTSQCTLKNIIPAAWVQTNSAPTLCGEA